METKKAEKIAEIISRIEEEERNIRNCEACRNEFKSNSGYTAVTVKPVYIERTIVLKNQTIIAEIDAEIDWRKQLLSDLRKQIEEL